MKHADAYIYNFVSTISFEYVNVKVSVFNYNLTACLDIDDEVTFMNRSLLLINTNLYDIVHCTQSIIVIEITSKQITDEYMKRKVQLRSDKKITLHIKIYLINRFQLELIIDMNTLERDDIDLTSRKREIRL